ncbi:MAG TPA: hypothetical protein PLW81_12500 [Thiobacillaceae bacterium]|nr:hypothetical protein [Thiobacillaceae bacterium]
MLYAAEGAALFRPTRATRAAFDPKLRAQGIERREMLEDIMRAAANGEQ